MTTYTHLDTSQVSPDAENGNHHPRPVEDVARAIILDILSPSPTYHINVDEAGIYSKHLGILIKTRKNNGLAAAQRTYETFKAQKNSPFGTLHEVASPPPVPPTASSTTSCEVDVYIPPLPEAARLQPGLGAKASPWLDAYTAYSRKWSPRGHESFHETTGIWLLSTIAARRVYCNFGKREYTSLYFGIVAHTTLYRKTTTVGVGQEVLEAAGLTYLLGPNMVTPQKLMSDMAGWIGVKWHDLTEEEQKEEGLALAFSGQRGWYYEEFGMQLDSMMQQSGPMADFRGLLRVLDDHHREFSYGTISRGKEKIKLPYLSLLGSMTPSDIAPHAKNNSKLWRDGLLARFVFSTPPILNKPPMPRFPVGERTVPTEILKPLVDWHQRLGIPELEIEPVLDKNGQVRKDVPPKFIRGEFPEEECEFSEGVLDAYYTYEQALVDIATENDLYHLLGNYGRLPKAALRVAMLLASLENCGVIDMVHWARAQEIAEHWRESLHHMLAQMTMSGHEMGKNDETEDLIVKTLMELAEPITASDLRKRKRQWRQYDTKDFISILDNLAKGGAIERVPQGKTIVYKANKASANQGVA